MAASGLSPSPQDLDLLTRAVVSEAQAEPDDGQAAIAHVALNRLAAGSYANTLGGVVMAPNQFEPTANKNSAFYTTSPDTPAYQHAAGIVQGVLSGDIPDPTGGATNFYSPTSQAALGRRPPDWASGKPLASIGGHVFYAPAGPSNGGSLLTPKPPQADNNPLHSFGSTDLPALAYADQTPAASAPGAAPPSPEQTPAQGQPMASGTKPDDFASLWEMDPAVVAAPSASTAQSPAAASTPGVKFAPKKDEFAETWKMDPGAYDNTAPPAAPAGITNTPTAASDPIYHGAVPIGNAPDMGATTALASGVQGVPIVGPAISRGVQDAAAAARSLTNDTKFSDEQRNVQEMTDLARQQHPIAAGAGDVAGATLATLPAMAVAPEAFGISQAPFAARAAASGATNALIGGTDSYVRGQDPTGGAMLGAAAGAGGPIVGKAVGSTMSGIANRLMPTGVDGMGRPAVNMLTGMLGADTPQAIQAAAARLGPDAVLPDLGPSMGGLAQGLAVKPGDAKSALFNVLEQRAAGANGRITTDLNQLLGPAEDPQTVSNAILANRSATDAANYAQVHGQNAPVDPSAVVNLIDQHLGTPANPIATGTQRTALQNLRNSLVASPAVAATAVDDAQPEAYHSGSAYLHNLRQEIDGLMDGSAPGLGVPAGAVSRANGSLGAVRGALDTALKSQVPGMASADAASAALAARADAVQQGTNLLMNGKTGVTPYSFAQNYGGMAPGEQIALNKGARGEIDRLVGIAANDPAKLRNMLQGDGGWNTAKLATAFGQQPTNDLVNAVGREGEFAATNNKLMGNSQTAQRSAAAGLLKDTDPAKVDLKPANWTGLALQAGKKGLVDPLVNSLLRTDNGPRDTQLGRAFSMQGDARDQLINQLMTALHGSTQSAALSSRADAGLTGAGNLLMGQYGRQRYPELTTAR